MKKELFLPYIVTILISAAVILICSVTPVLAEGPESNFMRLEKLREKRLQMIENHKQKTEELNQRRQDKLSQLKEKAASRESRLAEQTVVKIKKVFTNILNRFNAALLRLDKIAQRIANRIDKLKAKGVDTAGAEEALAAAESKGAVAALAIETAQDQIGAINASSSSVRDAVHTAVGSIRNAKKALKDYHKSLVETLRLLKAARALREGTESAD